MTDTLPPRPARRRRPLQRPRPRIGGRRACPLRPPVSVSCLNYRPVAPGSATRPYLPMTWGWRCVGG
jgi:hypothetical protein